MGNPLALLGVYGHPDDEQGVSGLMAKYADEGVDVTLVCATRGEAGEIAPGVDATATNLGSVREEELRCAADKMGVRNLYFLDYRDSGMMGTPENEDPRCLWTANLIQVTGKVVRLIRRHKPQVIVTFDPNGGYGHPDHIQAHRAATMAFFVAGDPRAYPEHLAEGLAPWTPLKLYWGAFTRSRFKKYIEVAEQLGMEVPVVTKEFLRRGMADEAVTTLIDVAPLVDLKINALSCHASQMDPQNLWAKIPPEVRRQGMEVETLILAESRLAPPEGIEQDLFTGIG